MILMHRLNEEAIERAYWEFNTERKRSGMERDAFKAQMRQFAVKTLDQAGVPRTIEIPDGITGSNP